jgi:hypothetical protein
LISTKYKTPKAVAHAQRALHLLALGFLPAFT